MNAEFNWWLLIVGLVVGTGIAWFVLMDARRRDVDIDEQERPREALWLSRMMSEEGHWVSPDAAERMLVLHRAYLEAPPPDDPEPVSLPDSPEPSAGPARSIREGAEAGAWVEPSELADDDRVGVERRTPGVGE